MRTRIRTSLVVIVTFWLALTATTQTTPKQQSRVEAVGAISMTVSNLQRSETFYSRVLSFERVAGDQRTAELKLGDERVELTRASPDARPLPADSRSNDRWFQHIAIIVSDMDRAYAALQANHVEGVSRGPQRLPDWNKNAAGIRAYYFKDPDGHPLEILQFPPDKGAPKWHRTDRLFLGIDHTAIVVANTDASLQFYQDFLGLMIAGTSENYGPEQERLNNVSGAHLRITTLRALMGPGIELLEYVAPRTGRRLPYEPRVSDLVHRHTTVIVTNAAAVADAGRVQRVTAGHQSQSLFVHDPDGHELLIRSKPGDAS